MPIPALLLNFQTYAIGMSADISRMFREIKLHPSEKDYHQFLFWAGSDQPAGSKDDSVDLGSHYFPSWQVIRKLAKDNCKYNSAEVLCWWRSGGCRIHYRCSRVAEGTSWFTLHCTNAATKVEDQLFRDTANNSNWAERLILYIMCNFSLMLTLQRH